MYKFKSCGTKFPHLSASARYRIFALTWCVYAGFYLCRKNLSVINGIGAIGAAFSPLLVATVSESSLGWDGLFPIFMVFSIIAALLMATNWNEGKTR